MTTAKKQIAKEISKLQKEHDAIMKIYYKSQTEQNRWGDGSIYQKADTIANNKSILIDALKMIENYEVKIELYCNG